MPSKDPRRPRVRASTRGMREPLGLALVALLTVFAGCRSPAPPLRVVDHLDLDRYLGRWYEIASFPQRFQRGCVATTASYSRREDGRIRVENQCRDGSLEGKVRRIEGIAWVADEGEGTNAKLEVQFFWPFRGDYWVIELDPEYRYAVVGHPSRKYLWILSRTPSLDEGAYRELLQRAAEQGYDVGRLERTLQAGTP
jgi:apolipoprotein D and lipocalin family protein